MSSAVHRRAPRSADVPRPGVLLVDDRSANLLALEAILEPLDLDLVRAGSGEEALRHLLKREFALILLDVQMAGMDGFETASHIKAHERTAELPIIFITAISREATHIFTGYARGAVDYLLKPFDPDILRAKVSVFVELYIRNETIKAQAALLHAREVEAVERRGANRLQVLAESMPIVMWALRKSGDVYYVNRAWAEYSGLTAEQTAGLDNPALLHPEDAERVHSSWMDALASRGGPSRWSIASAGAPTARTAGTSSAPFPSARRARWTGGSSPPPTCTSRRRFSTSRRSSSRKSTGRARPPRRRTG